MPDIINLRPRQSQNQLVLPYLPMPRPSKPSSSAKTAPSAPPGPAPLHQHPHWGYFVNRLARQILDPNPHLEPVFESVLSYADTL